MTENKRELVVVGGGISGLGFAHLAQKRGIDVLVLEAGDTVGGCINTHQFPTSDGDFWAEMGAHVRDCKTCLRNYAQLIVYYCKGKEALGYRMDDELAEETEEEQLGLGLERGSELHGYYLDCLREIWERKHENEG